MAWAVNIHGTQYLNSMVDMGYKASLFEGANNCYFQIKNKGGVLNNTFAQNEYIDVTVNSNAKTRCYIASTKIDEESGLLLISAYEKTRALQKIFPKEATVEAITAKSRSDIIKYLVNTQGHGNGVTVNNVQASPSASGTITEEFKGGRSLYDVIFQYAIEDGYQFHIDTNEDLHYEERISNYYTAGTLIYGTDKILKVELPENALDICNKVNCYGKADLEFSLTGDPGGTSQFDISETIVADDYKGAVIIFTVGKTHYRYSVSTNDTSSLTVRETIDTSVFSTGDKINVFIYAVAEDPLSQEFYKDTDGNILLAEETKYDPSWNTMPKCQRFADKYRDEHSWALQNVIITAIGYSDLDIGQLIKVTYPADGSKLNEYMLVTEVEYVWSQGITKIKVTYYDKDVHHIIMDIIDRLRKRDNEIIRSTAAIQISKSYVAKLKARAKFVAYTREASDDTFILDRNIIGNNKVADFNGTSSKVTVGQPLTSMGTFTWAGWIKLNVTNKEQRLFDNGWNRSGDRIIVDVLNSGGYKLFFAVRNDANITQFFSATAFADTDWHMVVCRKNNETDGMEIWKDNVKDANTGTSTLTDITATDFILGTREDFSTGWLNGTMIRVGVWDSYLSEAEMITLYNGGLPAKANLKFFYNQCEDGSTWYDESTGTKFDGTLANITFIGDNMVGTNVEVTPALIGDQSSDASWTLAETWGW